MCYWTTIPKNRSSYHPSRGVREEDLVKIVQQELVVNKDLDAAAEKALATDGLRRFCNSLKTDKEKGDFRRHLRRYLQIYLPDCPWEVNSTNRYTIVSHEASVTARRYIKRNESIKYLSGIQVNISPEEEKEISVRKKDFSIVVSSRNKCTSLFMGPARFANHDCGANAKLMTTSHAGIEIIATRPIEPGDEITVTYGENYFGEDNCECLCSTCEKKMQNGWAPEDGAVVVAPSIEEDKPESYTLRRRRRDDSAAGSSRTPSVNPDMRPRVRKTRPKSRFSDARDSSAVESPAPDDATPRGKKRPADAMATPPITPAKKFKHLLDPVPADRAASRGSSVSGSVSSASADIHETDATSPEKESPEPSLQTPVKDSKEGLRRGNGDGAGTTALPFSPESTTSHASPRSKTNPAPSSPDVVNLSAMSITSILNAPVNAEPQPVAPIAVSIETVEDAEMPPAEAPSKRKYQRRVFIKQTTPPARSRQPGDYVLTPLLLSQPEMAWIQCGNCDTYFVQENAYFTRSTCPRCERHSKLYGYVWPKTDKEGPHDKEERVMDHRTIHRFLDAGDERRVRGRKGSGKTEEAEEAEELQTPERGRQMKRGGRRKKMAAEEEEDEGDVRRSGRARRVSSKLAQR